MTLVEVVASILLLASLLTLILISQGRHQQQIQQARAKLQTCEFADSLISSWYASETGIPIDETGYGSKGEREFVWETRTVSSFDRDSYGLNIVELKVWRDTAQRSRDRGDALVSIQLLVGSEPSMPVEY